MASLLSCPVCRNRVPHFVPLPEYYTESATKYGFPYTVGDFETLNTLAYSCPNCHCSDRDRIYAAFLAPIFGRLNPSLPYRFLEIAPARALGFWVKSHPHIFYRSCDLYMPEADDKADIHNLPYADDTFDFLLCSHVLEHVEDPVRATSEIRRVLKPNGIAILMVPICLAIEEDYVNPEAVTAEDRWKHFGQDDHVRIFSKSGFKDVIGKAGLSVNEVAVTDFLLPEACETHGIAPHSVLYFGAKEAVAVQSPNLALV